MSSTSPLAPSSTSRGRKPFPVVWVIVAGGIISALSLGVRSTFGLFLDPVTATLNSGHSSFALAVAVQNLVWGFSQPIAGAISDRFGAARTLTAGAILFSAAMALMSTADTSGMVLLSGGFLTGVAIGAASFAVVLSSVGRMVSAEKRSMALGVVSAMGSIGQFFLIPFAQSQLNTRSWQDTSIILAVVLLSILIFTPFLRGRSSDFAQPNENASRPLQAELNRAIRTPAYLLLNGAFFVCGFHVTFIATHLPSYAKDLELSGSTASRALALVGLFNVFGSLAAGALGSRFSKTKLLASIYGLRAMFILVYLLVPPSATSTILFGAAIGFVWLATVPLTSAIVSQQFGTTHSGALFGVVFLSHQLGAFIGAWSGGALFDRTDSYTIVWWIAVALAVAATLMHLFLDDGPAPEQPSIAPGGWRIAGAGGLTSIFLIVAVVGSLTVTAVFAALQPVSADAASGAAAETKSVESQGAQLIEHQTWFFCPLAPTTN